MRAVPRPERRHALRAGAALALGVVVRPALALPEDLAAAVAAVAGGRTVREGRVSLELPRLADDGNLVAATLRVDSAMRGEDRVLAMHLLAEHNPVTRVLRFEPGPLCPRAELSTRIRLARSQRVVALAEMADGSVWSSSVQVEVTVSACGDE